MPRRRCSNVASHLACQGLDAGLRSAIALGRALQATRSRAHLFAELRKFDAFMQELREREMQCRSAAMLRPECTLPAWFDEIESVQLGHGPAAGSRTAALMQLASEQRSMEDADLCKNVKAWRSFIEARGGHTWPHAHLEDEVIEQKVVHGVTRQRPLTAVALNASAVLNPPLYGPCAGELKGWPVCWQTHTASVPSGNQGAALEKQGLDGLFLRVSVAA